MLSSLVIIPCLFLLSMRRGKKHSHKPWHHIRIMLNLSHENKLNEFIKIRQGFYGVIKKVFLLLLPYVYVGT